MSEKYIRLQDAVDALHTRFRDGFDEDKWWNSTHVLAAIKALPAADVVPVEILKAEIYKLKCQQDCKNQDYYTGYMSALSTVEGILAEMGEE